MKLKWFSYLPVTFAVLVATGLAFWQASLQPAQILFSKESLAELSTLNHEYKMAVEDLSTYDASSPLVAQLLQADALLPFEQGDPSALGLIATLKNGHPLLLQPSHPLDAATLEAAAQAYSEQVDEFERVETDQLLELSSPVLEWNDSEGFVQLSEDETTVVHPVKVAVIDSGMDETHEVFGTVQVETGWNTVDNDDTMYDDVGHGTHIAGIIATQAPGVDLVAYKIVGSQGGKLSNVLKAFSLALHDNVDVINTSFGVPSASYALQELVEAAYKDGVIVVSAAGNSGADAEFYPAHYPQTIAVASVGPGGQSLPSSNFGVWVDVAAQGYHVRSSLPHNEYGYKSGTSQATAFVSAAVARLLQANPDLNFEEVMKALQGSVSRVPDGPLAGTPIVE